MRAAGPSQALLARVHKVAITSLRALPPPVACRRRHDHAAPHDILQRPEGCGPAAILFYFTFPLLVCFKYTVPDVRYEQYTKWYPATMVISVVWLAFLAYLAYSTYLAYFSLL